MKKGNKYPEWEGENNPAWKGGKKLCTCETCHKQFNSYVDEKHKGRFCSVECRGEGYKGVTNPCYKNAKEKKPCMTCGNEFYAYKYRNAKFCSKSCASTYTVKYKMKRKDTDIEKILENFLTVMGTTYEKQKIIKGVCVADFFVEPNIVFFADGDYWHSLPNRMRTDNRVNERLKVLGFDVIRIKGSTLKHGLSNFSTLIL